MDSIINTLLLQGGFGITTALFFWLYLAEKRDHKDTRKEKDALMEARRLDAKETLEKIEEPLRSIAQSQSFIADKIVGVQRG